MKENTIKAIEQYKVITILRGIEPEKLIPLAQALYDGGIRLLELTYNAEGQIPDEVTAERIRLLAEHFAGRMFIGAGTVLTPKQAAMTKEAGGLFAISPDTNEEVIGACNQLGLVSIPGALTPTEIAAAKRYGADFVKVFPASTMGPDYFKAVKAPLSHIRLLAVGGVDDKDMADYLKAGACGIGVSSSITNKELIEKNDWAGITAIAKKYTEVASNG